MDCHDCHQTCQPKNQKKGWKLFGINSRKSVKNNIDRDSQTNVALVGLPNVGKSLLFNLLTGTYVTVSNYPGTTVEVAKGNRIIAGESVTFFDTPGMYSLIPITEEESVTRDLIMNENVNLVIHIVDAKNLGRMLNLTLQLIEAQLPVLLVVNMIDEAAKLGIWIDENQLAHKLCIPVVTTEATQKVGLKKLIAKVADYVQSTPVLFTY
ncbi:Small GTP-binding protein domain protein [Hyella patelloides LEGE 07179]|uniref:Small GTP-binding protein domain protein n=1 Tax=Hyella patelloides LEGE 07179 TaxID=945734 RepID=A0A563W0Z0_9CYAN|nr:FeoB small GTPase domain-containing protein [Hyella patelloides]VEP17369.1 Small GTP-binding protein domain protein [Hyella patelloides LEGE 07179]